MTADHTVHRPWRQINRRPSRKIWVGNVPVGGDSPITVQSMTNTVTHDVKATVAQIHELERVGADIVRVSCPDEESSAALKEIVKQVSVPIVADIHFHYKRAIESAMAGVACLRINPGNVSAAMAPTTPRPAMQRLPGVTPRPSSRYARTPKPGTARRPARHNAMKPSGPASDSGVEPGRSGAATTDAV